MDQKQLKSLLKVLRDNGVSTYKTPELELVLVPEALLASSPARQQAQQEVVSDNPYVNFPDGELTPEELAYYSSGGLPENSPFRKDS